MLVGYQHSPFYHFGAGLLPETIPVGGLFVTSLLGPYPIPLVSRRLVWYGGVGGTVTRLSDVALRADTLSAQFSTERTFAPEALLMAMWVIAPSYRVLVGASYQYLRFGSITYRPVQPGEHIPATTLAALPQSLELESVHLSLGFSFTAPGLIPRR